MVLNSAHGWQVDVMVEVRLWFAWPFELSTNLHATSLEVSHVFLKGDELEHVGAEKRSERSMTAPVNGSIIHRGFPNRDW